MLGVATGYLANAAIRSKAIADIKAKALEAETLDPISRISPALSVPSLNIWGGTSDYGRELMNRQMLLVRNDENPQDQVNRSVYNKLGIGLGGAVGKLTFGKGKTLSYPTLIGSLLGLTAAQTLQSKATRDRNMELLESIRQGD